MDTRDAAAIEESTSEISLNSSLSSLATAEGVASNVPSVPSNQTETKAEKYASEGGGEVGQAKDISSTISNEVGCCFVVSVVVHVLVNIMQRC